MAPGVKVRSRRDGVSIHAWWRGFSFSVEAFRFSGVQLGLLLTGRFRYAIGFVLIVALPLVRFEFEYESDWKVLAEAVEVDLDEDEQ